MAGQPGRVVIVGAGPAGMALAYLLARRGVGVTVLETHLDFARVSRLLLRGFGFGAAAHEPPCAPRRAAIQARDPNTFSISAGSLRPQFALVADAPYALFSL